MDNRAFFRQMRSLVMPIAFAQLMLALVSASDAVMLGLMSQDAMAAVSLAVQVQFVFSLYLAAMTIGTGMFAAQYWGKGDKRTVEQILGMVLRFTLPVSLAFTLAAAFAPSALMRIFTPDAQRYLKWMLVICAYYVIGKSVNSTTVGGIFCAGGDSSFGLVCDAVTLWCVTVPLGLLAAFVWRLPVLAVYFIVNLDEMIKLPAVYRHYKQYKWVKNLTEGNEHV